MPLFLLSESCHQMHHFKFRSQSVNMCVIWNYWPSLNPRKNTFDLTHTRLIVANLTGKWPLLHVLLDIVFPQRELSLNKSCRWFLLAIRTLQKLRDLLAESFYWATGTLVTSSLGFKVGSLICTCQRSTCYVFPKVHLWCNTCWHHGSKHGGPNECFNMDAGFYGCLRCDTRKALSIGSDNFVYYFGHCSW